MVQKKRFNIGNVLKNPTLYGSKKMTMGKKYECKSCQWKGDESELEYDDVESCAGNDKIEVCPECGSMNVWVKE